MNDEQFAELLKRLDQLTGKLGAGADGVWAATLAQASIEGVVAIFYYILLAAAGYGVYRLIRYAWANRESYHDPMFMAAIVSVVYSIVLFISISALPVVIAAFVNPNYWALRHLLKQFTK